MTSNIDRKEKARGKTIAVPCVAWFLSPWDGKIITVIVWGPTVFSEQAPSEWMSNTTPSYTVIVNCISLFFRIAPNKCVCKREGK